MTVNNESLVDTMALGLLNHGVIESRHQANIAKTVLTKLINQPNIDVIASIEKWGPLICGLSHNAKKYAAVALEKITIVYINSGDNRYYSWAPVAAVHVVKLFFARRGSQSPLTPREEAELDSNISAITVTIPTEICVDEINKIELLPINDGQLGCHN